MMIRDLYGGNVGWEGVARICVVHSGSFSIAGSMVKICDPLAWFTVCLLKMNLKTFCFSLLLWVIRFDRAFYFCA